MWFWPHTHLYESKPYPKSQKPAACVIWHRNTGKLFPHQNGCKLQTNPVNVQTSTQVSLCWWYISWYKSFSYIPYDLHPHGPIAICSRLNLPLVPFSAPQPRDQRPASPVALPTMVCLYDNRSPQSPVKVDGCLQVEHVEFPVLSVSLGPYEILWTSVSFPGLVPHCSHEASPLTVNSTSAKRFSNAAARIASSEFSFAPWKQKPLRPIYYL